MLTSYLKTLKSNIKHNILIIGFYNRGNLGDESYKITFNIIFGSNHNLTFTSIDDISFIEKDKYDMIIFGGGDIICPYFMDKANILLAKYTGLVYAVSVGIPYPQYAHYLNLFDHVFVRSKNDYELACKTIGSHNVNFLCDSSILLSSVKKSASRCISGLIGQHITQNNIKRIGICLAQPMFYNNSNTSNILYKLTQVFENISKYFENVEFHIIAFNSYVKSEQECDYFINVKLAECLTKHNFKIVIHKEQTVRNMIKLIQNMDILLCMRYHSVMFALICHIPFVALYVSQKVSNLLIDNNIEQYSIKFIYDHKTFLPIDFDKNKLEILLKSAVAYSFKYDTYGYDNLKYINKSKEILVKTFTYTFDNILELLENKLQKYLNISKADYLNLLHKTCPLYHHDNIDIARIITYTITSSIQNPYIWGLYENMQKNTFNLYDSIEYIWKDHHSKNTSTLSTLIQTHKFEHYYANISLNRRIFINMDYMFQGDFTKYHRSGWAYAISGLMNINSAKFNRESCILFDTYVDRTFHWGETTLVNSEIIPYKNAWAGIIHHTFDTEHSKHNCKELFKKESFLKSLETCKCLITLSYALERKVISAVRNNNYNIPVYSVPHPMQFVTNIFNINKFLLNKHKKVVQIGAWLRDPYAIYELPIYPNWNNDINISKAVLKGCDMDNYFKPKDLLLSSYKDSICLSNTMCRDNTNNKYCVGLNKLIERNEKSVEIIDLLNNEEYDELLSCNIVFINLIDCSAVNTILECIVRNTPIFVNRLPAIEEVLGKNYPGYYKNLSHAASLITDIELIEEITTYLKKIDKTKYILSHFVNTIQDIMLKVV